MVMDWSELSPLLYYSFSFLCNLGPICNTVVYFLLVLKICNGYKCCVNKRLLKKIKNSHWQIKFKISLAVEVKKDRLLWDPLFGSLRLKFSNYMVYWSGFFRGLSFSGVCVVKTPRRSEFFGVWGLSSRNTLYTSFRNKHLHILISLNSPESLSLSSSL